MAVRFIRKGKDPALRVVAKAVKEITPVIHRLLDDMLETLHYSDNGMALAAPQVGIAKRLVVIEAEDQLYELINPVIKELSGSYIDIEGCLSFPDVWGEVERAERVVVEAMNRNGEIVTIEAEGLMSRALQHEIDHLDGILFVDKVTRFVDLEDEK